MDWREEGRREGRGKEENEREWGRGESKSLEERERERE